MIVLILDHCLPIYSVAYIDNIHCFTFKCKQLLNFLTTYAKYTWVPPCCRTLSINHNRLYRFSFCLDNTIINIKISR